MAEVERARNAAETQRIRGLERLGGFGGVADLLNDYNHHVGDPGFLQKDIARYSDVTPATVKAFAQDADEAQPRRRAWCARREEAGAGSAEGRRADQRGRRVAPGDQRRRAVAAARRRSRRRRAPLSLPVPKSFTLANGLTVLLNDRAGLPVVSAALVLKSGSGTNPADKPGLANFTAAMIDEGTATRSALQIADEVAQLGGSLTTGSRSGFDAGVGDVAVAHVPADADAPGRRRAPPELPGG